MRVAESRQQADTATIHADGRRTRNGNDNRRPKCSKTLERWPRWQLSRESKNSGELSSSVSVLVFTKGGTSASLPSTSTNGTAPAPLQRTLRARRRRPVAVTCQKYVYSETNFVYLFSVDDRRCRGRPPSAAPATSCHFAKDPARRPVECVA